MSDSVLLVKVGMPEENDSMYKNFIVQRLDTENKCCPSTNFQTIFFSTLKPATMFEHEYVKDKSRKLSGFSYHQSESRAVICRFQTCLSKVWWKC